MVDINVIQTLLAMFSSVAAMAAGVLVLEGIIDRFWHLEGGACQARTFVEAAGIGTIGAGFSLGMFAAPECCGNVAWYFCGPLTGLGAGLIANKLYELWPGFKKILELIGVKPKDALTPGTVSVTTTVTGTQPQTTVDTTKVIQPPAGTP